MVGSLLLARILGNWNGIIFVAAPLAVIVTFGSYVLIAKLTVFSLAILLLSFHRVGTLGFLGDWRKWVFSIKEIRIAFVLVYWRGNFFVVFSNLQVTTEEHQYLILCMPSPGWHFNFCRWPLPGFSVIGVGCAIFGVSNRLFARSGRFGLNILDFVCFLSGWFHAIKLR